MSLQERIESLKQRHAHLELQIDEEFNRPVPDDSRIGQLKRQKLRIKDEIAQMRDRADA